MAWRQLQREAPADAERGESDDKGMWEASEHVDDAIDGADHGAGEQNCHRHQQPRVHRPENEAADDGRQGEVGPHRQVDAASEDDEVLPDRDNSDHGGLGENVADVDGLQEVGGQQADARDQNYEDQERAHAQKPKRQRNRQSRAGTPAWRRGRSWFSKIGHHFGHN